MKKLKPLFICIAIPLLVGGLSAMISGMGGESIKDVYQYLVLPPFAPPPSVFPVVWTLLYILMGFSSFIIYKSDSPYRKSGLKIYMIQLLLNFIWTPVFFGAQMYGLAFLILMMLWIMIALMIVIFYKIEPLAAYLLIPYFIWVTFAGYLNLAIFLLNR